MANPIRRIIQLVLDRTSAKKTEADAKAALGGIEGGLNRLSSLAKKVGAALGLAFAVHKIIEFGRESLKAAADSERIWNDLKGTIDATGGSFAKLEGRLKLTAAAFQDATTQSDEGYAQGLMRMITLTGNVDKSITNMGLAANVAAQFFNGDLQSGVDLVARTSQGLIIQLQRMGIHVNSAQEGLEVLASRSMGAAERQARTLTGQTQQLANAWDDFKEELGNVGIAANESTSILGLLKATVKDATAWVAANKDELKEWVAVGIQLAIDGFRLLTSTVKDFLQWAGRLSMTAGSKGIVVAGGAVGIQRQLNTLVAQRAQLEKEKAAIEKSLSDLNSVGGIAKQVLGGPVASVKALERAASLKGDLKSVNDQLLLIEKNVGTATNALANLGKPKEGAGDTFGVKPTMVSDLATGTGAATEDAKPKAIVDPVGESFAKFSEAMATAHGMSQLLGKDFDLVGAKSSALESHMKELLDAGISPLEPYMIGLAEQMVALVEPENKVAEVTKTLTDSMNVIGVQASAFGDSFDAMGARASALETAITSLASQGFDASNPIMAAYIEQLHQVRAAMKMSEDQAKAYGEAVDNVQALIVGAVGGSLKEVAKAKAKENLLRAAEETAEGIVSLFNPFTAAKAGKHFAAAAKYTAIAGGWAALGASIGGGAGGGGGGGAALGGARSASGAASEKTQEPKQEINIILEGPGFDALNPAVQRVVYGSMQQARERYGDNVKINLARRSK